jgi:dihydroorotate dehydrogenase
MPYLLVRPLLFRLDAEIAHMITLSTLNVVCKLGLANLIQRQIKDSPRRVMGLTFPNPVGLAAGMDKNGEHLDALSTLGFGFVELGTVTPRPQPGNPRPRVFRLPQAQGLVNRLGFNNKGVDYMVENISRAKYTGVLGVNIGMNSDTPISRSEEDYLICLRAVYLHADYVAINISSPNTAGLRKLQTAENLDHLLSALKSEQDNLAQKHGRYVPIAIKIAPDLTAEDTLAIAAKLVKHKVDGVIATNTTVDRTGVEKLTHGTEAGGLSGTPLRTRATKVVHELRQALPADIPIIGVGGITSGQDAVEKLNAGASLVQIYTGLVYQGPNLIGEIAAACHTK